MRLLAPTPPRPSLERTLDAEIPVLYRVARRLARTDAEAEDLVGATLLRAVDSWARFDGRHPRSWLIAILRNERYALHRREGVVREVALETEAEPSDECFWHAVDWSLAGAHLNRELDRLPEEYRLAVTLCDVEEMSYEEAAAALDVPSGTIRSRLFRGRKLLRARLAQLAEAL